MKAGLLGEKLSHSYSPSIHRFLGDYSYDLFEISPENLSNFLKNGDFDCLNVTIPYKKAVIPYCKLLSAEAAKLVSVNTIVRQENGDLYGYNSDYFGFYTMVKNTGISVKGKKALVLGSGGASATAVAVLEELGANVIVISRSGENNYTNICNHLDTALIVNTTPVGMYPNNGQTLLDISCFQQLEGVLDVIYNPARTKLLIDAESKGIKTENGLKMLVAQAKHSAQWFTGQILDDSIVEKIHQILSVTCQNIILVGMPGSGKSTIGKKIAEALGREFTDSDAEIVKKTQMSIPEIFAKYGEARFRNLEAEVLRDLGKRSGLVIATGGGCVTRRENYDSLHQNGIIFWLQREIGNLPTQGRPLSQSGNLEEMQRIRYPLYQRFADYIITNDGTQDDAVNSLLQALHLEEMK